MTLLTKLVSVKHLNEHQVPTVEGEETKAENMKRKGGNRTPMVLLDKGYKENLDRRYEIVTGHNILRVARVAGIDVVNAYVVESMEEAIEIIEGL